MVWKRINQLKNSKNKTYENILLTKDDGKLTKNDDEVLEEMRKYIKLNFYQEKEEIDKETIDNETWNNNDDWKNDMDNIDDEIKEKGKTRGYTTF